MILKIKFKNLFNFLIILTLSLVGIPTSDIVSAESENFLKCTDLKIIFARGSGSEIHATNYQTYVKAFEDVLDGTGLSYSFYELGESNFGGFSYPSPGIGISTADRFTTSLGALVSGGGSYSYGESVEEGSNEARVFVDEYLSRCPSSKIIMGGYSQGGQTISRALQKIPASKIFYAATFGDPKLYLPEGEGIAPAACANKNLSDYRAFVPDCHVVQGILGGYKPYSPNYDYSGKLGAYCRYHDVICGTVTDPQNFYDGHANYKSGGVYELAAWDVYAKLFPQKAISKTKQNVAILFDVTGSMGGMLAKYQSEAIKTAEKVMKSGGKVALYYYGDLEDYETTKVCDFEECSLEEMKEKIKNIVVEGGGDDPESLLSASYTLMKELKWDTGANKSLIILTDASFHSPDRDLTTIDDVIELSKRIDPVNFYILADGHLEKTYSDLVIGTNGSFYSDNIDNIFDKISNDVFVHSESQIINTETTRTLASISDVEVEKTSSSSVKVSFATDDFKTILALNDEILGFMDETEIEISDLDFSRENCLTLIPISDDGYKNEAVLVNIESDAKVDGRGGIIDSSHITVLKAPNAGGH